MTDSAAIRRVLQNPIFELIPLKNVLDQAKFLPDGATVSVTASPAKGMDATLDLSEQLQDMGFDVVPHLSARLISDRAHLERILDRLDTLGVTQVFVVGGDGDAPGEFYDGLSLLMAMKHIGHDMTVGVPSYPEGHPFIPDAALDRALSEKQPYAGSMTTQMCFSGETIAGWIPQQRANEIRLPVILGIPGVANGLRLLKISARIGVGDSIRFLRKNVSTAARFVKPGSSNPAELLESLGHRLDDPLMNIEGVHIYTFNSCDTTEAWRQQYLDVL
ncbi:MAG: methylenetetrahydrofolate reductase [Acidimicrobiia bacterium]|nr:MAG: methylenetetrahydrofolate reductase [Acidimicrobiia bacterium]